MTPMTPMPLTETAPRTEVPTPRRMAIIATAVFGTLLAAFIAWQLRDIILLFIVSLAVASMIRTPIDFWVNRHMPRGVATAVVVLIGVAVIAALLIGLGPFLVGRVPLMAQDGMTRYEHLRAGLSPSNLTGQIGLRLLPTAEALQQALRSSVDVSFTLALGLTTRAIEVFTQCVVVIVLAIYWTTDRLSFERLWLSLLPPEQRIRARTVWRSIEDEVGAYLRSEATQTLLTGIVLYATFAWLGVSYPVLLAALGALCWLIPIVGVLVALPLIMLIAGLNGSIIAFASGVLTLLVYALMEFILEPRLYHRRRFSTIWTVLTALALLDALGLIGLFVAPVVATIVQIILEEWLKPTPVPLTVKPASELANLRQRLADARTALDQLEQPPPYVLGLLARLEKLTDQVASEV